MQIKPPKIYVAGHTGLVGSAIVRSLNQREEIKHILTCPRSSLDLRNQSAVREFLEEERPDQIYLCAAKVGGIHANSSLPAEFIYENLIVQTNVIHEAWRVGVKKLLFLGSSCIYPKFSVQPIPEEALLSGPLEPTNEPYAIAKIAGIKLCESYYRQYGVDYRSVMPTNLYGPGDNYHPQNSHVIPGLIRRFHDAKKNKKASVTVWGSGEARREFLFIEDMAEACIHLMNLDQSVIYPSSAYSHINIGYGTDITIRELALAIQKVVDYKGEIIFDRTKPDGTPRKLVDTGRLKSFGWSPKVNLQDGLIKSYQDFLNKEVELGQ